MKNKKISKDKQVIINKINEIGISNVWMEQSSDCDFLGVSALIELKNGEIVSLNQWFNMKPSPEKPYIEVYVDGNCAKHLYM